MYTTDGPRHLHSFPTRRSSDLAGRPASEARFCISLNPRKVALVLVVEFLHPGVGVHDHGQPALEIDQGAGRNRNQDFLDRKSTRLNSSHPSISYAVFCLKKKKI